MGFHAENCCNYKKNEFLQMLCHLRFSGVSYGVNNAKVLYIMQNARKSCCVLILKDNASFN